MSATLAQWHFPTGWLALMPQSCAVIASLINECGLVKNNGLIVLKVTYLIT